MNQKNSLNIFNDQNDTDAEKLRKESIIVFTQTKFNTSPKTEVFAKHGYINNPENVLNQPATDYFPLEFDADDEFFSVQIGTMHIIYAHSDDLSSYTATFLVKTILQK